ncbi:hypothetical protein [Agromyces seonyuensis]|uniref:Uncharacterized protein n=1 Tax=Agromyces seonyuensis TaxID=2662446 RepID=A0A6I4P074_9MICO|nr:hypothetical protein [Agromyces seonyuensis]MWB97419.1 hypothetical protein [Agromyces seonyuensis]
MTDATPSPVPSPRPIRRALGAVLLVNAVPHGVAGVQGRPFPSPFSEEPGVSPSSPAANVAWSAVNAVGGLWMLRGGARTRRERVAVGVGAVAMAFVLASWFGGVDERSRPGARRR